MLKPFAFGALLSGSLFFGLAAAATRSDADAPAAEPKYSVTEHYTKYEFRIPMRDGAKLFTVVYMPKDQGQRYPFLVQRTPYAVGQTRDGRVDYGVDFTGDQLGPAPEFDKAGYIFVNQDVRGRFMSDGKWQEMQPHKPVKKSNADVDASTDMHDTVDWLLKHIPGNNGKVGIWGISYPGFYTSASIIDSHPAIKAASPQAPVTNLYMGDDSYHGGAFMLSANYDFYTFFTPQETPLEKPARFQDFDYGTDDGYDYFLRLGTLENMANSLRPEQQAYFREQASQPNYTDYWKARDIAPHLRNIHAAVMTVGGWFDAEDAQGTFTTFHAIEANNPGITNALVVGPWVHGGWADKRGARLGQITFGAETAQYYRTEILFPFFERYLRDAPQVGKTAQTDEADKKKPAFEIAKATVFETGTNVWRRFDAWPPKEAQPRTLYFQPGGALGFTPPAAGGKAYDEYVSDPAKPVPFIGYAATGTPREYMVGDQRFAGTRPDVLVYQTAALEEDVTLVGPIVPKLFVSTSGTDADWVVKLIDVYPSVYPDEAPEPEADRATRRRRDVQAPRSSRAGYQQLVRGEPLRGKFRNSFERPEPFTPDAVTPISYRTPDINHTFRRGHRIMVQVQSSWFPLIDRNPQVFMNIPDAKPEDFRSAVQRVYHAGAQASGLSVLVLPGLGQ